jgi:hypothetical protein
MLQGRLATCSQIRFSNRLICCKVGWQRVLRYVLVTGKQTARNICVVLWSASRFPVDLLHGRLVLCSGVCFSDLLTCSKEGWY